MSQRVIIGVVIVLFLALIGGGVWYYFSVLQGGEGAPAGETDGDGGLFPFGEPAEDVPEDERSTTTDDGEVQPAPVLRQVTNQPIAGATIISDEAGAFIHYIEQAQGHVFRANATTTANTRISNTTIPEIQTATWAPDAEYFIARYFGDDGETVRSFSGNIAEGETQGTFLRENITDIALRPDGERVAALTQNGDGSQTIATNPDGTEPVSVRESSLSGWDIRWETANELIYTTRGSARILGSAYALDLSNGAFTQIVGARNGLATLPDPDGTHLLYSETENGTPSLAVYDRTNDTHRELALNTFAEKCVWSRADTSVVYCAVPNNIPQETYPDAWYRGDVSFTDALWRINVSEGRSQFIFDVSAQSASDIDVVDLRVSSDDSLLIFTNKRDGSLWALDLTQVE